MCTSTFIWLQDSWVMMSDNKVAATFVSIPLNGVVILM